MTTDYNPIAEQYQRSKEQPWRTFIECYTLVQLLGDVRGKSVLDLACGAGFYTRIARRLGAGRVVGLDLSAGMIELARAQEASQPLGIDYAVGDARQPPPLGTFDLVIAAYLLNYAHDRDELQAMCDGIAKCLGPGGRFVSVNSNPHLDFSTAPSYRPYGFETRVLGEWREGAPVEWTFFLNDGPFSIENYYLDAAIHEAAFRRAGLPDVRWHAPRLSPEAQPPSRSAWSTLLDHPPITFVECTRTGQ